MQSSEQCKVVSAVEEGQNASEVCRLLMKRRQKKGRIEALAIVKRKMENLMFQP